MYVSTASTALSASWITLAHPPPIQEHEEGFLSEHLGLPLVVSNVSRSSDFAESTI
jgi:hypothetical protein